MSLYVLILRQPRSGCLEGRMPTIRQSRNLSQAQTCQPREIVTLASRSHALPKRRLESGLARGNSPSCRDGLSLAKAISTNHLQVG